MSLVIYILCTISNSIIDKPHDTMILLYTTLLPQKKNITYRKGEKHDEQNRKEKENKRTK